MKKSNSSKLAVNSTILYYNKLNKVFQTKISEESFETLYPYILLGLGWFAGKSYPDSQKISYYNFLIKRDSKDFSDETLRKAYKMLNTWNGGRSGKLVSIDKFISSVRKCEDKLKELAKYKLGDFCDPKKAEIIIKIVDVIFRVLEITSANSKIVTFSKIMHLLLPQLFIPIDRKMTLQFFQCKSIADNKDPQKQFDWIMVFLQVIAHLLCAHCKDFQDFSANTGLPITKIIDSIFIGYEIAKKLPVF